MRREKVPEEGKTTTIQLEDTAASRFLHTQKENSWVLRIDCNPRGKLKRATYQAKIITQEDYALLQDQTKESVTLSDGSTLTDRQPSFY